MMDLFMKVSFFIYINYNYIFLILKVIGMIICNKDKADLFTRMVLISTVVILKKYMFIRESENLVKNMESEKNRGLMVINIKETILMIKKKGIK